MLFQPSNHIDRNSRSRLDLVLSLRRDPAAASARLLAENTRYPVLPLSRLISR
ncbi:MAG: hypothetical protein JXR32_02460 [Anaerolineaceae bacterium]|nr:hypothetical protein [Anaerolineaceae bacterium]